MKVLKYLLLSLLGILSLSILCPFILFIILHYWILTPEYLTSSIKQAVKEHTYLTFDCQSIELNYLSSWPSISLVINEGTINLPENKDTLTTEGGIVFHQLKGNIQLKELLAKRKIQLDEISLERPQVKLSAGAQMPILLKDSTETNDQISFSINNIDINNAHINVKQKQSKAEYELLDMSLTIDGDLASKEPEISLVAECKKVGGHTITNQFGKELSLVLQGQCIGTNKLNDITFVNTSLQINQFPFLLNGSIYNIRGNEQTNTDLSFHLAASSLKEIIDFVPQHVLPDITQYTILGKATLEGQLKGIITNQDFPDLTLKCMIDEGSVYKKDIGKGIDTISLSFEMSYLKDRPDSCYINLNNAKLRGLNSYIELSSRISNLQQSPFITADFKGNIDFNRIEKEFIPQSNIQLDGKIESELSVAFNYKDLKEENFNRIWIDGMFKAPQVIAKSEKYDLDIFITNANAAIGYKKNKSNFIQNEEVLSSTIKVDTLKMQYDKSVYLSLSKLDLRSNTALAKEHDLSSPITVHIKCQDLQAKLNQDRWIKAQQLSLDAGSKSVSTKIKSEAACIIQANDFLYLDNKEQNAIAFEKGDFLTELHPNANNKWDIKGLVNFQQGQIYTSHYPIDITSKQARISFKNNQVAMDNIHLNIGESECILSGLLTASSRSASNKPQIKGTFKVLADYINYNELKETFLYAEAAQKEFRATNIENLQIDELSHIIKESRNTNVQVEPYFIPKNIDLGIDFNINNMNYENLDLHQVNGNVILKNQKAYTNLSTRTNLGKINLIALYDSENKEKIQTKFDLKLKDVLVAQIHKTMPTVTTLFPMVASMDGLIDCHLTLSSQLNNQMLPILNTTEAICALDGENLTLFDHEVFKNIAKKLRFKNKEKNVIDQLSTNIILQNNQVEIIPFLVKWDRYKAIIGGTHTTDSIYNYHITMLESPIPTDLGVNLSGKADDLHYKFGKCKYKDLYKDDGKKHQKDTKERLNLEREKIIKQIMP